MSIFKEISLIHMWKEGHEVNMTVSILTTRDGSLATAGSTRALNDYYYTLLNMFH